MSDVSDKMLDMIERRDRQIEELRKCKQELLDLVKGIVDTRHRHSIDNHQRATWNWDERANAAIAKAEART